MKNILKMEEALMLALAVYLNSFLPYEAWIYWALFLTPDIGMIGYVLNPRVGAATYNIFHHKGIAIAIFLVGALLTNNVLQLAGLVLFGHSSFDRMLGYGLKSGEGFQFTHLGVIGGRMAEKARARSK
ncbi:MAG TPA: DUF4260 domain-containing protein [Chryseosolibacter sp.]|nr:DUF4260 domain-containing protein [Chryseosolibacter sp.]